MREPVYEENPEGLEGKEMTAVLMDVERRRRSSLPSTGFPKCFSQTDVSGIYPQTLKHCMESCLTG